MKKINSIITGALSGAVLFMAVQVGVAQEKEVASDNMEATASMEATTLGKSVQKLQSEWAKKSTPDKEAKLEVMKEPKVNESKIVFVDQWFLLDVTGATDETDPEQQILELALDPMDSPDAPCNEPTGTPCAVRLTIPSNIDAEDLESLSVDEALGLTGVEYADGTINSYTHKTP